MSDLTIHPVYLSARAAIVAPERAIPLSVYATHKWLPRLGPERWALVLLLRSLSIDAKRRSDGTKRVSCSWRQLSEMLDVHEETVASWLKHQPIPNDKPWRRIMPVDEKSEYLSLFIPRLRYAYETRNGKTRRVGFLLEVLMEDPVVPEDEARLEKQMELLQLQQGSLNLETYRLHDPVNDASPDLPKLLPTSHTPVSSDSRSINPEQSDLPFVANNKFSDLPDAGVNPEKQGSPASVKQEFPGPPEYVKQSYVDLPGYEPEVSGKNVNELDILIQKLKHKQLSKNIRREVFAPIIEITEQLLDDDHSTGMLYKVLRALYPERMDLYVAAVRVALDAAQTEPGVNKGAVFVRALRDFTDIAGVNLGFQPENSGQTTQTQREQNGNPGSHFAEPVRSSFQSPSETEAVWSEVQAVLRHQMTRATFDAIIQPTMLLRQSGDQYIVGVRSEMAQEWLENRLHDIVQRALSSVVATPVEVKFELTLGP
jgi:hypothetical protein